MTGERSQVSGLKLWFCVSETIDLAFHDWHRPIITFFSTMSGKRERGSALRDIIQNTISVSKELEALQREHQAVFPTKTGEIQRLLLELWSHIVLATPKPT